MSHKNKDPLWMEHAAERMKKKGTVGRFGKATKKKISRMKRRGRVSKKRAVFAQTAKKIASKRRRMKR